MATVLLVRRASKEEDRIVADEQSDPEVAETDTGWH